MALDHLRIVAECAAGRRARPGSAAAQRRLEESICFAGRFHAVNEIAEIAGMLPADVDTILQPSPTPAPERERTSGFARTVGVFRNSPA
jgi:hypothetical protein